MAQNKYEYQSSAGGLDWECHKRLLSVENDIRYIRDSFQHLNATVFQCRVHPGKAGWTLQEYLVLWGLALTFVIIIQLVGDGKIINLRVAQLFTAADVNHGVATGVRLAAAGGGEATHHLSQPSKNSLRLSSVENGINFVQDPFRHLNASIFQRRVHPALPGWTLQEYLVLWGLALTFVIIIQLVGDGKIINLRVAQLFTSADVNRGVATGVELAA